MSPAENVVGFIFKYRPIFLKFSEPIVWVSNILDLDQTPSNSASDLDPSYLSYRSRDQQAKG